MATFEQGLKSNNFNGELAQYGDHLDTKLFWLLKLTKNTDKQIHASLAMSLNTDNATFPDPDPSQTGSVKIQFITKEKLNLIN